MKKANFLFATGVLIFSLMGTAYAYWAEELTITTTVQTGQVNMGWSACKQTGVYPKLNSKPMYSVDNTAISSDTKLATLSMGGMLPDTRVSFVLNAKNNGTVPTKIKDFRLKAETVKIVENTDGTKDEVLVTQEPVQDFLKFSGACILGGKKIEIVSCTGTQALQERLTQVIKQINQFEVVPGEALIFEVDVEFSGTTKEVMKYSQHKTKMSIELDWTQHNDFDYLK